MEKLSKKNLKWWGFLAIIPSTAMIFTDQSILPVALPTIQDHLGASNVALQWCVNSYLLSMAVFALICGKLGDRIGSRRAFTLGMILFALSSALCGFSTNVWELVMWRGVQGLGAAFLMPAAASITASLFPKNERGKAMGINISIGSIFLIIAPLIGGYFTEMLSWRWIFWVNLPIASIGLLLNYLFLPTIEKGEGEFDYYGFCFFLISTSLFVIAIMQGRRWGWTSLSILSMFAISIISGFLLLRREKKAKHPFLDLTLFKQPVYKAISISIFFTAFILMITVFRTIYFQEVLEWSPLKVGMVIVISSTPIMFMSTIGGMLSDRFGPKLPVGLGFLALIYSFFWLAFFSGGALWTIFVGLLVFAVGIPLVFTPSFSTASKVISPKKVGIAYGTLTTLRSIGATLGVALIGAFYDTVQYTSFKNLILKDPTTKMLDPYNLEGLSAGIDRTANLEGISPNTLATIGQYMKESQIAGFEYSHLFLGFLLVLVLVLVFMFYNRKSLHKLPDSPAEGWD